MQPSPKQILHEHSSRVPQSSARVLQVCGAVKVLASGGGGIEGLGGGIGKPPLEPAWQRPFTQSTAALRMHWSTGVQSVQPSPKQILHEHSSRVPQSSARVLQVCGAVKVLAMDPDSDARIGGSSRSRRADRQPRCLLVGDSAYSVVLSEGRK